MALETRLHGNGVRDWCVAHKIKCHACGRVFTPKDGVVAQPNYADIRPEAEAYLYFHIPACPPPDAPSSNALAPGANHNVDEGWE